MDKVEIMFVHEEIKMERIITLETKTSRTREKKQQQNDECEECRVPVSHSRHKKAERYCTQCRQHYPNDEKEKVFILLQ